MTGETKLLLLYIYLMFIPLPSSLLLLDISHSSPNGFNSWGSTWYCSDPPQIHERFVEEYCASIFMMV